MVAGAHWTVCSVGLRKRFAILRNDRNNRGDLKLFKGTLALNASHVAYEETGGDLVNRYVFEEVCHDALRNIISIPDSLRRLWVAR